MTTPLKGRIETFVATFHSGEGTVRLEDGSQLAFFRYSCAFGPIVGMTVYVWGSAPHHTGGLRATDLTLNANRLPVTAAAEAPGERRAQAILRQREEALKAREEEAKGRARLDTFLAGLLVKNPAPHVPSFDAYFDSPVPAAAGSVMKHVQDLSPIDTYRTALDPAWVPILLTGEWLLAFVAHPELPLELTCIDYDEGKAVGAVGEAGFPSVAAWLEEANALADAEVEDEDAERALSSLFRKSKHKRSDAKAVASWLGAEGDAQAKQGAVLLDLYEERDWKQLHARAAYQVASCAHRLLVRAAGEAFVREQRGRGITERAADALIAAHW